METCPGRKICEKDTKEIKNTFNWSVIIRTKGKSLKQGWNVFRSNEKKLKSLGIIVIKGEGRCSDCPITTYVKSQDPNLPS